MSNKCTNTYRPKNKNLEMVEKSWWGDHLRWKNAFKVWKQLILEVLGVCKVMLDGAIALPYCKSSCDP